MTSCHLNESVLHSGYRKLDYKLVHIIEMDIFRDMGHSTLNKAIL